MKELLPYVVGGMGATGPSVLGLRGPDLSGRPLLADWSTGSSYVAGQRVFFEDVLLECLQDHTSSALSADLLYWKSMDPCVSIYAQAGYIAPLTPVLINSGGSWVPSSCSSLSTLSTHMVVLSSDGALLLASLGSFSTIAHGLPTGAYYEGPGAELLPTVPSEGYCHKVLEVQAGGLLSIACGGPAAVEGVPYPGGYCLHWSLEHPVSSSITYYDISTPGDIAPYFRIEMALSRVSVGGVFQPSYFSLSKGSTVYPSYVGFYSSSTYAIASSTPATHVGMGATYGLGTQSFCIMEGCLLSGYHRKFLQQQATFNGSGALQIGLFTMNWSDTVTNCTTMSVQIPPYNSASVRIYVSRTPPAI